MSDDFSLEFHGYYFLYSTEPEESGIYCIYRSNPEKEYAELLYIGESDNIIERLHNHEHYEDWQKHLRTGDTLLFSYAIVDGSAKKRQRIEAALIFHHKPVCNTQNVGNFGYETTTIKTKGDNACLCSEFTV